MKTLSKMLMLFFIAAAFNVHSQQIIFEDFENGDPFTGNITTDYPQSNNNCPDPGYTVGHNLNSVCDDFPDVPAENPEPGHCMSTDEVEDPPSTRTIYRETGLNLNTNPHVARFRSVQRLAWLDDEWYTEQTEVAAVMYNFFPFGSADGTTDLPLNNSSWTDHEILLYPTQPTTRFRLTVTNPQRNGDFAVDDIELCGTDIDLTWIGPNRSCMDGEINICGTVEGCGYTDHVDLLIGRNNQVWLTLEVPVNTDGTFCYTSPNSDELLSLGLERGLYYDVVPRLTLNDPNQSIVTGSSFQGGLNNDFHLPAQAEASAIMNKSLTDLVNDYNTFCYGDPIFFHGTADESDRFHIGIRRRLISNPNDPFAWVTGKQEHYDFDGASYDLTTEFDFEIGYEYQITFGVSDVPDCVAWTPVVKTFKVIDCCEIEPFGYTSFPECTYEGHVFTIDVFFNETLTEDDIALIYSTNQNFDLLSTSIEVSQPSGSTTVSLTFESRGCSCEGDMVSFDIRLEGCENNIWIMSDNIPCCRSNCSGIELEYLEIVGECEIVNGEVAYTFEGWLELLPGTEIVSITAKGKGGICPANVLAFDYEEGNGGVSISGIVQSLNPDCEWGDIVLIIDTEVSCCKLRIPISYPEPCEEECLASVPNVESLCYGRLTISVPGSVTSVKVTNNLNGQTAIYPIGTVNCYPILSPNGNPQGVPCPGFIYRFNFDCENLENPEDSRYDITIAIGECKYRFVGDYCQSINCPILEDPTGDGGTRSSEDQGKEIITEFEVNLYPNPAVAGSSLNVKSTSLIKEVSFLDMQGRILASQQADQSSSNFTMITPADIQPGIYVVKLVTMDDEAKFMKLLILNQ